MSWNNWGEYKPLDLEKVKEMFKQRESKGKVYQPKRYIKVEQYIRQNTLNKKFDVNKNVVDPETGKSIRLGTYVYIENAREAVRLNRRVVEVVKKKPAKRGILKLGDAYRAIHYNDDGTITEIGVYDTKHEAIDERAAFVRNLGLYEGE